MRPGKKLGIALTLGTLVCTPLLSSSAQSQEQALHFGQQQRLFTDIPRWTDVAHGPEGRVYVVSGLLLFETHVRISTDFGTTFSPSFSVSEPAEIDNLNNRSRVVADNLGSVVVSWIEGNLYLATNSSLDNGQTWGAPLRVTDQTFPSMSIFPDYEVLMDEDRRFYVAYRENDDGFPSNERTRFRRSLDGGGTFEIDSNLWFDEIHTDDVLITDLVADGLGSVYVSMLGPIDKNSARQKYINTSFDFGETWLGPVLIDPTTIFGFGLEIACGPGGHVYAVYLKSDAGFFDVYFAHSTDFGRTFGTPIRLDTATPPETSISESVEVAADVAGNIYVTWKEGLTPRINVSQDFGQTWTGDRSIGADNSRDCRVICTNDSGHVAVVWETFGVNGLGFNTSRDFGDTWIPGGLRIDDPGEDPHSPTMIIDPSGRVYAAWLGSPVVNSDDMFFRTVSPTLGISLAPQNDGDGFLVVPPEGGRIKIDIDLRNHHPSDPITGLTGFLEAIVPSGQRIGPIGMQRTFGIPFDGNRSATFRANFPGAKPPGLYFVLVTTEGAIEDSVRMPILKQ